jgi:hypothetical protein
MSDTPSLPQQLKEAARTAAGVAVAALHGSVLAADPGARLAICAGCRHEPGAEAWFEAGSGRCKGKRGCNCAMAVKVKLAGARCPVGKW